MIRFPIVSAKKVIIARSIGEAPLSRENFPIEKSAKRRIMAPDTTQTIIPVRNIINTPIESYFGGPRNSSAERLSMFSIHDIRKYD